MDAIWPIIHLAKLENGTTWRELGLDGVYQITDLVLDGLSLVGIMPELDVTLDIRHMVPVGILSS